jgi:Protein of unknown function (DUF5132)/YjzC-like protein
MRFEYNPGEKLWNGAVAGIGVLGSVSAVILKTFIKSGYSAYLTGRQALADTKETVEDIAAEARAEIHADHPESKGEGAPRQEDPEKQQAHPGETEQEEAFVSGIKPGTAAPASGHYQEIGPRGGKGREVGSEKGDPLPPTTKKGSTYTLVEPTDDNPKTSD